MGRPTNDELLAVEQAVPPPSERPPPSIVVGPDHPVAAVIGTPYRDALCSLTSMGYHVKATMERLDGTQGISPCSVRVQTSGNHKRPTIVAVAVCRKLVDTEQRLVEAYHWLPAYVLRCQFPSITPTFRDDLLSTEGQPFLCYSAIKFDNQYRFGTYARVVLSRRYKCCYTHGRQIRKGVSSLDDIIESIGDFVPDRPAAPDASAVIIQRAFDEHAPYATGPERELLTAYLGLDGARTRLADVAAKYEMCTARARQVVNSVLYAARAYKRGAAGSRA